ncbi:type I 3-dehydroquinate dehydratase [Enterocloster asparagiformis]|uniref:type I 3-dehydroquinate dehydratase n=1 Tax=Enterocloster asparagiformis TaxID=333367 RepID=UPI0034BA405B
MNTVHVRNITIGEGIPKICVPIVASSGDAILKEARRFAGLPADLVEWRLDWFDGRFDLDETRRLLAGLREALGDKPLLATFRTFAEGGACEKTGPGHYEALVRNTVDSGCADLVDVELAAGAGFLADLIPRAHDRGVKVILSHHNFSCTPELSAMLDTLERMEQSGGDILKIAVMPQSPEDVLTLLSATSQARARFTRPVVTMSMAGMGVISRLSGEVFGSALTFGSAGQASAPGQIGVEELRGMLELLHQNL